MDDAAALKPPRSVRTRWWVAIAVAVLLVAVIAFAARGPLLSFGLGRGLTIATGYDVHIGSVRLGREHGALFNVHVGKSGDPVLDARRIDASYQLRDVFPGGDHRFGFVSLSIDHPTLTIIRHHDGTFNFNRGASTSTVPASTKHAGAPLFFDLRIRSGEIRVIDLAATDPLARRQLITGVSADATIKTDQRTHYALAGSYVGARRRGDAAGRYPISARGTIDYPHRYALHRLRAAELPIRAALNFAVNTPQARAEDGVIRDLDVAAFALGIRPDTTVAYHLGGGGRLDGGEIALAALRSQIRDLRGPIQLYDSGITAPLIDGSLSSTPIHATGAIYGFTHPEFRLGVSGNGDLHALRRTFTFSATQPVSGPVRVATLIESAVSDPLIVVSAHAPAVVAAGFGVHDADASIVYHHGVAVLAPLHAFYGASSIDVAGRILLGGPQPLTRLAVRLAGNTDALPYASALLPQSRLDAVALIDGVGLKIAVRGSLQADGATAGNGFFAVDPSGDASLGPFSLASRDGGSMAGGLSYVRRGGALSAWLDAQGMRIDTTHPAPRLPGLSFPAIPAATGTIDGSLAAVGTYPNIAVAGRLSASGVQAAGTRIHHAEATVAGTLDRLSIPSVDVVASLGEVHGSGTYAGGTLQLAGTVGGSLDGFAPAASLRARGMLSGPIAVAFGPTGHLVVQLRDLNLRGGSVRGVRISGIDGTVALDGMHVSSIAALANVAGRNATLVGNGDAVAVSATGLDLASLGGFGLPVRTGALSVLGVASLAGGTAFNGEVAVSDAAYRGLTLTGNSGIDYRNDRVNLAAGGLSIGATYGSFDGTVAGITSTPRYDLNAHVRGGNLASVASAGGYGSMPIAGSFDADMRIRGFGTRPAVAGAIAIPEGIDNGLAFTNGSARIAADASSVSAQDGRVRVGSTTAAFSGTARGRAIAVRLNAPNADLADFDEFFDEADTLAGIGRLRAAYATDGRTTTSSGDVAIRRLRYHRFELGDTTARWFPTAGKIQTAVSVGGAAGSLRAAGTVALAAGDPRRTLSAAHYSLATHVRGLDLKTWLPAFNITMPILGFVDADARVDGRYPSLGITSNASLTGGQVGPTKIERFTLSAVSQGTRTRLRSAELVLPFGTVTAGGTFSVDRRAPLALNVHTVVPRIADLAKAYLPHPPDVSGSLESDVSVTGSIARPNVRSGFDVEDIRYGALRVPSAVGSLALAGKQVVLRDAELIFQKGTAAIAGTVPVSISPFSIGPRGAPLDFDVTARSVDVGQFAGLFPSGTKIRGTLDGHFGVAGQVGRPRLFGSVALGGGSYVGPNERVPLRNVTATLGLNGRTVALEAFHADAGTGKLDATGSLALGQGRVVTTYAFTASARHAQLDLPAYGRGTVDAALQLSPGPTMPLLSGDVALSNALIPFSAISNLANAPGGGGGTAGGSVAFPNVGFNLQLSAAQNVRLQGSVVPSAVLNIGGQGTIALRGSLGDPHLDGTLTADSGGTLTDYNRIFRVQSATVAFDPAGSVIPDLELRATTHVWNPDPDPTRNVAGTADVTIDVSGPATTPRVTYTSDPPYSTGAIVGLLLDAPLLGTVDFAQAQAGTLRGAPGESNVELPPTIVSSTGSGNFDFNQEAFNVFNAQVAQRFLAPAERLLGSSFGLSELSFNIDYGGGIGFDARKQITHRPLYAIFGSSLNGPAHQRYGIESHPDDATSIGLSIFRTKPLSLLSNGPSTQNLTGNGRRITPGQPLSGTGGFTFTVTRLYP